MAFNSPIHVSLKKILGYYKLSIVWTGTSRSIKTKENTLANNMKANSKMRWSGRKGNIQHTSISGL